MSAKEQAHNKHRAEVNVAQQYIPTYSIRRDSFIEGIKPENSRWAFKAGFLIRLKVSGVEPEMSNHVIDIGRVNAKGIGHRIFRCAHCDYRGKAPQAIEGHWLRQHEANQPNPEAKWFDDETCGGFDKRPVEVRKAIYAATEKRRARYHPRKGKFASMSPPRREFDPATKINTRFDGISENINLPNSMVGATHQLDSRYLQADFQPSRPRFDSSYNSSALKWPDTDFLFAPETQITPYSSTSHFSSFRHDFSFPLPEYDFDSHQGRQGQQSAISYSSRSSGGPAGLVGGDRNNPYMQEPAGFRNEFERYNQISNNFDMGRRYPLGWSSEPDGLLDASEFSAGMSSDAKLSEELSRQSPKFEPSQLKPQQPQARAASVLPDFGWSSLDAATTSNVPDRYEQNEAAQELDLLQNHGRFRGTPRIEQGVQIEENEQCQHDGDFKQGRGFNDGSCQQNEQDQLGFPAETQTSWNDVRTGDLVDLRPEEYIFSEQEMKELDDYLLSIGREPSFSY